jgi:hypothetical protein
MDMSINEHFDARQNRTSSARSLCIVGRRVVWIRTRQMSETTWLASGSVSPTLPTDKHIDDPVDIRATGGTESEAIEALKRVIIGMDPAMD